MATLRAFYERMSSASSNPLCKVAQCPSPVRSSLALELGAWLRVALHAGYDDQAHLIAEFHDLVGVTPMAPARRAAAPPASTPAQRRIEECDTDGDGTLSLHEEQVCDG